MAPITVKQLKQFCDNAVKLGYGDRAIMISQDDECNGYHYLWGGFSTVEELEEPFEYDGEEYQYDFEYCDENVAPKYNTIILT